jgi:hypothetical protein
VGKVTGQSLPPTTRLEAETSMLGARKTQESKALMLVNDKVVLEHLPVQATKESHPLAEALADFMQQIDDLYFAVSTLFPATAEILSRRAKKLEKTLSDAEEKIKTGTPAEAASAGAAIVDASHQSERLFRSRLPLIVEQSLFVNLFSQYDFFFGLVLRELYKRRPDLLASLSKQISFDELIKFESIESIKNSVLEAEIESIRRESYVEQFSILQKKFGIPLTKFQEWPDFVESAQRRNLLVHCGGHVSEQYLQVCDAIGYKFENRPKVGDRLTIGQQYFERTARLVARVGLMLIHTLWRKVLPAECAQANDELNDQIYRLLCAKRWQTVADLGTFSLSDPMLSGASDIQKRIRLVNTAIALKNLKREEEMGRLLASVDWSASVRDFRFAICILKDQIDDAILVMRQIGKRGELVHEIAYHQWPLFNSFRGSPAFHKTYEEVYGYPFYLRAEKNAEEARTKLEQAKEAGSPGDAQVSKQAEVRAGPSELTKKKRPTPPRSRGVVALGPTGPRGKT